MVQTSYSVQRDESLEVAGNLITNPEMTPPALCLERGFPTARLPSRLRENLGNEPQVTRGHGMWRGSGCLPSKGIQVIRCGSMLPLRPRPSSSGEGEEAE